MFDTIEIEHIPREEKIRADVLSKLVSTRVLGGDKMVIQETLNSPSIKAITTILVVQSPTTNWMTPITKHILSGILPSK